MEHTEDLLSVVKTMKTLSAVSIRHYEKAVDSLQDYNDTVEKGLHMLFFRNAHLSSFIDNRESGPTGIIVFGSELGMCGQFNEELTDFTVNRLHEKEIEKSNRIIITLGNRIGGIIQTGHQTVEKSFPLPGSVKAITGSVQKLLVNIEKLREERQARKIMLFFNHKKSGASYEPEMLQLWPLDTQWLKRLSRKPWPSRSLPFHRTAQDLLLSGLIRQYFFVSLYRAFAESLASENASRLAAMQAAEKNIQEQWNELKSQYNQLRQSAITAELLDIVSGFEALAG
jgi:F-type H+-transporting ATPase subunit gamma